MPADQCAARQDPGVTGSAGLSHEALVYRSDQEFLDGALPILCRGLDRGEPVLVAVPAERAKLLRDALGDRSGSVRFEDSEIWCAIPGWTLGALNGYLRRDRSGARVWVLAEALWDAGGPARAAEWSRMQSVLNVAFASATASVVCAYDAGVLSPATIAAARATHPGLTSGGQSAISAGYQPPAQYAAASPPSLNSPPVDAEAVSFDVRALGSVRRWAQTWADRQALGEDHARDLLIAVHEIVSNAVEHGGGSGIARFWGSPESLFCEVTSPGVLTHPFPGYLPPDLGQPRGRGLWMARQICTQVDVRSGPRGVDVRLTFSRTLTAPAPD
ncbi:MAG: sensor histidine kinase [Actinomycetia bacterium]|nr:sensor histidine kinase [Actinomycetes bacterium]